MKIVRILGVMNSLVSLITVDQSVPTSSLIIYETNTMKEGGVRKTGVQRIALDGVKFIG